MAVLPAVLPGNWRDGRAEPLERVAALRALVPRRPVQVVSARWAVDVLADLAARRTFVDGDHAVMLLVPRRQREQPGIRGPPRCATDL